MKYEVMKWIELENEMKVMSERMKKCLTECNEWRNEWMNEWANGWVNEDNIWMYRVGL